MKIINIKNRVWKRGLVFIESSGNRSKSRLKGKGMFCKHVLTLTLLSVAGLMFCNSGQASFPYGNYTYPGGSVGGNAISGSKSTYMAMTSPDLRNIRVIAFSIDYTYSYNTDPRYIRMGLYEGGVQDNPTGAQLKYETGPILINNTTTYDHLISIPPYDLGQNAQFGLALKTDVNFTGVGLFTCQGWTCPADAEGGDCDFFWNNLDEPQDALFRFDPNESFNPTIVGTNLSTGHKVSAYSGVYTTFYYSMIYVLFPSIDNVTPAFFNDGQTNVFLDGAGFENKDEFGAGTSRVWLTENNDWVAPGTKVQQTDNTWGNNSITLTVSFGALVPGTTAYLWVENSDGEVNATGYPVQLNVLCLSPPSEVINALTITPDDGTYIPGTFTVTDEFSDAETVYGCLYSLDDGSVWQPGVVSGVGPYTCTAANVTATDGTLLSIRMKATSCGGTSTSDSLLSRTVDAQGPVSTSFSTTPDDTRCTIDWSGIDNGTGMHVTEPFELRWGPWALSNCSSGTRLYLGTDTSFAHTSLENGKTYHYKLCLKDNYGNISEDAVSCTLDATPWTVLGDGTSPPDWYTTGAAINTTISVFTLELANGLVTDTDTITELIVTGTNTANISNVKIYRDDGATANKYDSGDTFLASAAFSGSTATFSGLSIPVTTTTTPYVITYDIVASPTQGETLTAFVTSATAQAHSVDNNDNVDATLTLDTTTPATTDNVNSSSWQGTEKNVNFFVNDSGGSGVDTTTGLYGCFGAGCTPSVLGKTYMTTNCGAGNTCEYAIRYYAVDRAGNIEPVNTDSYLARVDRELPVAGTFKAFGSVTPIKLVWDGFTDSGSGMGTYRLRRDPGPTPPADCLSGTQRYLGSSTSFNDSSVTIGQQYSYRLCAYDAVGNFISGSVATATAGASCTSGISCVSCHGSDMGGSKLSGPMGHALHGPDCGACHREGGDSAHVDGWVTIRSGLGYWGGDYQWPGGGAMTCGGPGNPVSCHTMGTPNYPGLTPEWECMWDSVPICNPPPGP